MDVRPFVVPVGRFTVFNWPGEREPRVDHGVHVLLERQFDANHRVAVAERLNVWGFRIRPGDRNGGFFLECLEHNWNSPSRISWLRTDIGSVAVHRVVGLSHGYVGDADTSAPAIVHNVPRGRTTEIAIEGYEEIFGREGAQA